MIRRDRIHSRCNLANQYTYRDQGLQMERTTGFEPATLTLARLWFPSAESVPVP